MCDDVTSQSKKGKHDSVWSQHVIILKTKAKLFPLSQLLVQVKLSANAKTMVLTIDSAAFINKSHITSCKEVC